MLKAVYACYVSLYTKIGEFKYRYVDDYDLIVSTTKCIVDLYLGGIIIDFVL